MIGEPATLAGNARRLGHPADVLAAALALVTGRTWSPICAACYSVVDPHWTRDAHRAADVPSYCARCSYSGPDVLAVEGCS